MKILSKFKKKSRDETGAASTIEMIIIIPILWIMTMLIIDVGFYVHNKNVILSAAQEGARLTSLYGGSATTGKSKTLKDNLGGQIPFQQVKDAAEKGLVGAKVVGNPSCTPNNATSVGQQVSCTVTWEYKGFGSIIKFPSSIKTQAYSTSELRH